MAERKSLFSRDPHLEVLRKPLKKPKPKILTVQQKKELEPSYVTPEYDKSRPLAWYYANKERTYKNNKNNRLRSVRHNAICVRYNSPRINIKTCSGCGLVGSSYLFDYSVTRKNGAPRKSYCFKCRKEMNKSYYQRNKERLKAKNNAYYHANSDDMKKKMKEYYHEHRKKSLFE